MILRLFRLYTSYGRSVNYYSLYYDIFDSFDIILNSSWLIIVNNQIVKICLILSRDCHSPTIQYPFGRASSSTIHFRSKPGRTDLTFSYFLGFFPTFWVLTYLSYFLGFFLLLSYFSTFSPFFGI